MPAESVDGMDVEAVHRTASALVERARSGLGPSFLHCVTYRYFGHHTAERTMGLSYRSDREIEEWRSRDPLNTATARLTPGARQSLDAAIEEVLDEAIEYARSSPHPDPKDALDFVYSGGLVPRGGV